MDNAKNMGERGQSWWQRHRPTTRRLIQLYSALLHNAYVKGFITGDIYKGKGKYLCAPGFNCYSCPAAAGACPLGAIQNALGSADHRAGWYVLGIIVLYDNPDIIDETYTEEMARADQAAVRTDVELIQSALTQQLQTGELAEPVDPSGRLIGQTLEFETTDLDGNAVKSADLFRDNKITMVNLWGTWCSNCINEMAQLAQLHTRLQEKGCGIVGLERELKPIETVADTARAVMTANGTTYPNAIAPQGNPIIDQFGSFPTTVFVDSEGKILTYPIVGAAVEQYEPTVEALLAGESADAVTGTGAVANGDNKYCVYVYDTDGNPVAGAFIQFCDDATCAFQPTDANGLAEFRVDVEKVYEVHVIQAPEGFRQDERSYETLDSYCDVNIFLEKAE